MSNPEKRAARLPVIVCEPDGFSRAHWLDVLSDLVRREYPHLTMEAVPGGEYALKRMLDSESGILLVILSVPASEQTDVDESIRLFLSVMERNRDSYVLLCIHNIGDLSAVLSRCMRPAGVMVVPFQDELMQIALRRILSDYVSLCAQDDSGDYMVVHSGKARQRIAYRDILYLEAQDKLLNVNLERSAIAIRSSLNALEKTLPEDFIRCHRSYIVNRLYIDKVSMADMTIQLTTQETLPISRSYKEPLRERLKAEGWI